MTKSPRDIRNLYKRIRASVPLMITVAVHAVLIAIAGYFIVSEQIVGKKRSFQAAAASESIVQKQVEHRLQVARKGGGSSSVSPVSAARIFSTATDSLQMPALPDLPQTGASSLSGMGFGKGMGAAGTGTGYNTGLGASGGLGRGFMSMSFLGVTSQRVSRIVFIVDVGRGLLDIRKGGFEAFAIIREEIMKLIGQLPPSAEFNVVLYESDQFRKEAVAAMDAKLLPATVANKEAFFKWMRPVNATPDRIGFSSVSGPRVRWTPKDLSNAGIDDMLRVPEWTQALQFALELNPEVVYIIAGGQGSVHRAITEEEATRRKESAARREAAYREKLKREGIDVSQVSAARNAAYAKARAELKAINAKLRAKGKSPLIVTDIHRVFQSDFQAELKKLGYRIVLDKTGWTDKNGRPLVEMPGYNLKDPADFDDVFLHVSKLQRALLRERAALNYFLFVGPDEKPQSAIDNLSKLSSRNGGKFQLLTTRRLQELAARNAPE